jgi:hypothetical protein
MLQPVCSDSLLSRICKGQEDKDGRIGQPACARLGAGGPRRVRWQTNQRRVAGEKT